MTQNNDKNNLLQNSKVKFAYTLYGVKLSENTNSYKKDLIKATMTIVLFIIDIGSDITLLTFYYYRDSSYFKMTLIFCCLPTFIFIISLIIFVFILLICHKKRMNKEIKACNLTFCKAMIYIILAGFLSIFQLHVIFMLVLNLIINKKTCLPL